MAASKKSDRPKQYPHQKKHKILSSLGQPRPAFLTAPLVTGGTAAGAYGIAAPASSAVMAPAVATALHAATGHVATRRIAKPARTISVNQHATLKPSTAAVVHALLGKNTAATVLPAIDRAAPIRLMIIAAAPMKPAVAATAATRATVKSVWTEAAKTVQDMAHVMSALAVIACVLRNAVKIRIAPPLRVRSV
jgi:hypothetical protein